MAYEHRRTQKKRSSNAEKASKTYKRRFRNKPVEKAMKKDKAPTVNKRQTKAIGTLARQVKSLQLSKLGSKQFQFQAATIRANVTTPISIVAPMFFAANSFYNGTDIYRGTVNPQTNVPTYQVMGGNIPINFQKQTFDTGLENEYQWNERANLDSVNKVQYLPVFMNYKFRFFGQMNVGAQPLRYRVTFFKMKRQAVPNSVINMALPQTGGAYWHMCDDDALTRNHFSKSYHHVIADRFVTFYPPTDTNSVKMVNKIVSIKHAFNTTTPLKPNIGTNPAGQKFWSNINQDEIIWCLISTNYPSGTTHPNIVISIERGLTWRDQTGTLA